MKRSMWHEIFEKWMHKNGYDLDRTNCMWAVLSFVQHLEYLDAVHQQFKKERVKCLDSTK